MKIKMLTATCVVLMLVASAASQAFAKKVSLTDKGQAMEAAFTSELASLRAQVVASMPKMSARDKAAFDKAVADEQAAKEQLAKAREGLADINKGRGLVGHAKNKWIREANQGIKETKAKLAKAASADERKELEKQLAHWEQNLKDGQQALKERQAFLDAALARKDQIDREVAAAEKALADARQDVSRALDAMQLDRVLATDERDDKLVRLAVINHATPRGLAAFAQQGSDHTQLIKSLLQDTDLMRQMLVADGAEDGLYGEAMVIYNQIQQASDKADQGVFQRLALATALEHAVPNKQRSAKADTDAPEYVDPVNRYLHFEKAFIDGELDPAFPTLSVWDYRHVVNGEEPDHILAWGRQMLRDYRPDHITTDDQRWRYVALVRTDIRYGSQENKYDQDELQFFQNILMNGGICGRRAFIGRFILRSFGVPTTARPQRGHAALVRYTDKGWVPVLGAGWGGGWTKGIYRDDLNFLATTQARELDGFIKVKRAQWIGDAMGEHPVYGLVQNRRAKDPGFWYAASLYTQRDMIESADKAAIAAVGEELGEANESDVQYAFVSPEISAADRKIRVNNDGTITIPAAATSSPTKSTGKVLFMDSNLGGKQLHYSRTGKDTDFTYTFNAPKAGPYALTAKVVSPTWKQFVHVKANGSNALEWAMPHTVGTWDTTQPVTVQLKKGENTLTFSRKDVQAPVQKKGLTFKEFTLTPANTASR